jgi:2'-5' RNA ligase
VNLDVACIRRMANVALTLREHGLAPKASWVSPPKMHVTLKFFGSIDVGIAPAIGDALEAIASGERAYPVRVQRVTAFPSVSRAHVIVLELDDPSGALREAAKRVEDAAEALGFPREQRSYRPHVTLARIRQGADARPWLEAVGKTPGIDGVATEIVLYRSDLYREGAEYTPVARVPYAPPRPRRQEPSAKR